MTDAAGLEARAPIRLGAMPAAVVLGATLILAAVLRFIDANSQMWFDEIITVVRSVRQPLGEIVTHFPSNNDHVLYSVLANLSVSAFGEHPWVVRLPAILAGVLSIGLIYSCGTKVTNRYEALSAALIAAVAYQHVWFSQNARGYTILLVVALASTQLLLTGLKEGKRSHLIAFGVIAALGAYTHLTMVLAVIGQAIAVALDLVARRRFAGKDWIPPTIAFGSAALVTVLLYAPLIGDIHSYFTEQKGFQQATAGWALGELARVLAPNPAMGASVLIVAFTLLVGCLSYLRQNPLILGLFLIPAITVFATAVVLDRPTFPRFFFFAAGFLILLAVRGAFTITEQILIRLGGFGRALIKPMLVLATLAMAVVGGLALPGSYGKPKQDYAGAMAKLEDLEKQGATVAIVGPGAERPYLLFYEKAWPVVTTLAQLRALQGRGPDTYIVYTFASSLHDNPVDLQNAIKACETPTKFNGTLADGDVLVRRCQGPGE